MARLAFAAALFALGCSSADFEVPVAADSAVVDDTASPPLDTGVVMVDTAVPEVVESETCTANKCGGCVVLAKPPGTACGVCGTSQAECRGSDDTACKQPDDRSEREDSYFSKYDGSAVTVSGADEAVAISFKMLREASPVSLKLAMQRYDVEPTLAVGEVQIRLIKGYPMTAPPSSSVLATSSIAATLIPLTPTTITVVLGSVPAQPAGSALWIEVTDRSPLANFAVNGAPGGPADLYFYYRTGTTYTKSTTVSPYLAVGLKGCF